MVGLGAAIGLATALVAVPVGHRPAAADLLKTAADPPVTTDDPAAARLAVDWGVGLAEAQLRMQRQLRLDAFESDVRALLGERFGGIWIDHARGGQIRVGSVAPVPADQIRQLAAGHNLADVTVAVPVLYGQDRLQQMGAELSTLLDAANNGAVHAAGLGIRTDLNAVELVLPAQVPLTPAQHQFVGQAHASYGLAIRLSYSLDDTIAMACAFPHCDQPMLGGVQIETDRGRCTAGFVTVSRGLVWPMAQYVLTAGHCVDGDPSATWYGRHADRSRQRLGVRAASVLGAGGDAGTILMGWLGSSPPPSWPAQPWFYRWSALIGSSFVPGGAIAVRSWAPSPWRWPRVGGYVCKSGATTATTCGRVTAFGVSVKYSNLSVPIHGLTRATLCVRPGDSGGPVYTTLGYAEGLVSGGTTASACNMALFQPITPALEQLGVRL